MSGDLKSEGLTTEVDLTFLFFKSESARFDFLHPEVDPGIQVLHPKVDLGIQVLHPEVDLGILILHSEVDLGISEAAGNHVPCIAMRAPLFFAFLISLSVSFSAFFKMEWG